MSKKESKPEAVDASLMIDQARGRTRRLQPYDPSESETAAPDELSRIDESQPLQNDRNPEMPKDSPEATTPKEDNRRRKSKGVDYEDFFFREAQVKTRSGKVVYIRKEYHDRILKILRIIGQNEISLFSYLDNVLKHPFDQFQDDMAKAYNQKNTDDFFNK